MMAQGDLEVVREREKEREKNTGGFSVDMLYFEYI